MHMRCFTHRGSLVQVQYRPPFYFKYIKEIGDQVVGTDGVLCAGGTGRAPLRLEADPGGDVGAPGVSGFINGGRNKWEAQAAGGAIIGSGAAKLTRRNAEFSG